METTTETYRPELTKMPENIAALPVFRGYRVPWFVAYPNGPGGEPEFRVADKEKWRLAVTKKLCWVCGGQLGAHLAFVLGPMCGITRTTVEPANHLECAEWSVLNCPFLVRPQMVRREDNLPEGYEEPAGNHIPRNPGVTLIWRTRAFHLFRGPDRKYLIRVGDALGVMFYAEGRRATREEVDTSVAGGLPKLVELAKLDGPEAEDDLARQVADFQWFLPAR